MKKTLCMTVLCMAFMLILIAVPPASASALKGDVNLDGSLTDTDLRMLKEYIVGTRTLSGQALQNADVNGDGNITSTDVAQLNQRLSSGAPASANTSGTSISIMTGDVNMDGRITSADLSLLKEYVVGNRALSGQAQRNADMNGDGRITSTDVALLNQRLGEGSQSALLGDVDLDGELTRNDLSLMKEYIVGNRT